LSATLPQPTKTMVKVPINSTAPRFHIVRTNSIQNLMLSKKIGRSMKTHDA
jgi:hypothetical protein